MHRSECYWKVSGSIFATSNVYLYTIYDAWFVLHVRNPSGDFFPFFSQSSCHTHVSFVMFLFFVALLLQQRSYRTAALFFYTHLLTEFTLFLMCHYCYYFILFFSRFWSRSLFFLLLVFLLCRYTFRYVSNQMQRMKSRCLFSME